MDQSPEGAAERASVDARFALPGLFVAHDPFAQVGPTIDERQTKLLELIRDATAARLIRWKSTKRTPDLYTAADTPLRHGGCYIRRLLHPV